MEKISIAVLLVVFVVQHLKSSKRKNILPYQKYIVSEYYFSLL